MGVRRQGTRVGDADVGEAVGQEQRAPDPDPCSRAGVRRGSHAGSELAAAGQPAAGQIGRAPGVQAVQGKAEGSLDPGRGAFQPLQGLDGVVVDDQRRPILLAQVPDGDIYRLLHQFEWAPAHVPGSVQDEGHVDRGAAAAGCGIGEGADANQQGGCAARGGDDRPLPAGRHLKRVTVGRLGRGVIRRRMVECGHGASSTCGGRAARRR